MNIEIKEKVKAEVINNKTEEVLKSKVFADYDEGLYYLDELVHELKKGTKLLFWVKTFDDWRLEQTIRFK